MYDGLLQLHAVSRNLREHLLVLLFWAAEEPPPMHTLRTPAMLYKLYSGSFISVDQQGKYFSESVSSHLDPQVRVRLVWDVAAF